MGGWEDGMQACELLYLVLTMFSSFCFSPNDVSYKERGR
jgi:hypothetical protein